MKLRILCHFYGPANCMPDSPMYSWAVRELGAEICYFNTRNAPPSVKAVKPEEIWRLCDGCDVAAYFPTMPGADINSPWIECPTATALKRARNHSRLVAVFGDGGCPLARYTLRQYADADCFDAMACVDGNVDWPYREQDFVYWGLFDPKPYERALQRTRRFGFNGSGAPERHALIASLGKCIDAQVGYPPGDVVRKYQDYADWMLQTRAIFNTSWTSYAYAKNSKGRVNEAALAGCLLFETGGSATRNWFTPGEEYLEYSDPLDGCDVPMAYTPHEAFVKLQGTVGQAEEGMMNIRKHWICRNIGKAAEEIRAVLCRPDFDEYAEAMGARMKARLLRDYGPERFWQKVCNNVPSIASAYSSN